MTSSSKITPPARPFSPTLDDLLWEYEMSFCTEFVTNPNGPHSHLKKIRQRMKKHLNEKDTELLTKLEIQIPIHLVFSSNGFNHRLLASNLRDNRLELQTGSVLTLCRHFFTGGYTLIRLRAISELIVWYSALLVSCLFYFYVIFVISWVYLLFSPLAVLGLLFALFLVNKRVGDFLEELVQKDDEFSRQALLKHWISVASTDK